MTRHLLDLDQLGHWDVTQILDFSEIVDPAPVLTGKGVALLFEKPSARTRNSTEMAVVQLGGHPLTIRGEEVGFSSLTAADSGSALVREENGDIALTLACYHAVVGARVFAHRSLEVMVEALADEGREASVVNLLSDRAHPCQILADLLTIRQLRGSLHGARIAYVGDANNVCRSLAYGAALVGLDLTIASPEGYGLPGDFLESVLALAERSGHGGRAIQHIDPHRAVEGAEFVYTDVWTSMGQEQEAAERDRAFEGYTVDTALMSKALDDAVFLHCLPAHRGQEVSADVIDGPASRVWQQAENRMHAMRGLFLWMFS